MKSLEQAIAGVAGRLNSLAAPGEKQAHVLALIQEWVGAKRTLIQLTDQLGRNAGTVLWPLPDPTLLQKMAEQSPAFATLGFCDETWEYAWNLPAGTAFPIPDPFWVDTPTYRFVYGPVDHHHIIVHPYPFRSDGFKILVAAVRGRAEAPFGSVELGHLERICNRFAAELAALNPFGQLTPRHAVKDEHTGELDAELRPQGLSLHLQALLGRFYGEVRGRATGRVHLPAELEEDIRRYRHPQPGFLQRAEDGFHHAFTKRHRGRVLCLAVHSRPDGTSRLEVHEDQSQHERINRMMTACRRLKRDRTAVFSACLALADGVRDHEEIVRRIRLPALKKSSALRIINRARSIVSVL